MKISMNQLTENLISQADEFYIPDLESGILKQLFEQYKDGNFEKSSSYSRTTIFLAELETATADAKITALERLLKIKAIQKFKVLEKHILENYPEPTDLQRELDPTLASFLDQKKSELPDELHLLYAEIDFNIADIKTKVNKILAGENSKQKNINVYIHRKYGIFTNQQTKQPCYPIKRNRAELIYKLKDGRKSGPVLVGHDQKKLSQLNKDIRNINSLFQKNLMLKNDFIITVPTGGYELNDEKYIVNFLD